MQVVFTSGDKVIGRLGPVTSDGFTLHPHKKEAGSSREIHFADIRAVKSKWTTGEKWLITGLIYAVITALFTVTLGN